MFTEKNRLNFQKQESRRGGPIGLIFPNRTHPCLELCPSKYLSDDFGSCLTSVVNGNRD